MATPLSLLALTLAVYAIADREIEKRVAARRRRELRKTMNDINQALTAELIKRAA